MPTLQWILIGMLAFCVACGDSDANDTNGEFASGDDDMITDTVPGMGEASGAAAENNAGGLAASTNDHAAPDSSNEADEAAVGNRAGVTELEDEDHGADETTNPDSSLSDEFLTSLIDRIADATCAAVSNCCTENEPEQFFGALGRDERLGEVANMLPPNMVFDPISCPSALASAYQVLPFGPYLQAVEDGLIEFNREAADDCLDALESVTCGESFGDVFFGGRCFGFSPPVGSDRIVFSRLGQVGDACRGIPDGYAGGFYGTCDPLNAWCASTSESGGKNITPLGETGRCVAVAREGQSCGFMVVGGFNVEVCARGLECEPDSESLTDSCQLVERAAIEVGEPCYEQTLLGYCEDGWCDMFGSRNCEPYRQPGETCDELSQEACTTGVCKNSVCSERQFCGGHGQ